MRCRTSGQLVPAKEGQAGELTTYPTGPRSSGVERLLGKEEVMSSNLIAGSIEEWHRLQSVIERYARTTD